MPPTHREISPFLKLVRDFLLGRKHVTSHRYADTISPRSLGAPTIPDGPSTLLFANHYHLRDARRQVKPPIDLVVQKKLELAAAAKAAEVARKGPKAQPAPGQATKDAVSPKTAHPKQDNSKVAKDCQDAHQKETTTKLPTPGKLHEWD